MFLSRFDFIKALVLMWLESNLNKLEAFNFFFSILRILRRQTTLRAHPVKHVALKAGQLIYSKREDCDLWCGDYFICVFINTIWKSMMTSHLWKETI